jgi:hypothetical protein
MTLGVDGLFGFFLSASKVRRCPCDYSNTGLKSFSKDLINIEISTD